MAQGYIECLLSGSRMYRVLVEWLKGSRMCHDSRELKTEKEGYLKSCPGLAVFNLE